MDDSQPVQNTVPSPIGDADSPTRYDGGRRFRLACRPRATSQTQVFLVTVRWLLTTATPLIEGRGLTLVGVAVASLEDDRTLQLALPLDRYGSALDAVLDDVRDRFGSAAVTRAVLLGRDQGASVPLLPD